MAQPLPSWLKLVTLRYQDSDQFTTGLVELPITYSGPPIPLTWPYTSIASDSLTSSPPLSSPAPLSPQVVNFVDGGGPFTVLGDVILTPSASIHSSPTISTAMISATPTPPVFVMTTVVVAQPTPSPTSSSNNPASSPPNLLEIGFAIMLITFIVILFAISIILIKCHKRRDRHVSNIERNGDCLPPHKYEDLNAQSYPQDPERNQAPQHLSSNLCEGIPTLLRQHASLNAQIQEKKLDPPETQFLITPQRSPKTNAFGWMRWKKLITKFQPFNKGRAVVVYDQPVHQVIPYYSNPYHDPSISTDTGERITKWRMKCGSPSSSALRLPSTITSNKHEHILDCKTPYDSLSEKDQAFPVNCIEFTDQNQYAEGHVVVRFNPTSGVCEHTEKMKKRYHQALKEQSLTAWNGTRINPVRKSPECASPSRGVSKSQSDWTKKSVIPNALFDASAHVSSSFGRITRKKNTSKRYADESPPLLTAECEADNSESDEIDAKNSPLEFHQTPLQSPSRCRKGTPVSSSAAFSGIASSFDSMRSPQSPSPSVSSLPLVCSAKKVRRKKNGLTAASSRQSLPSPPALVNSRRDHISTLKLTPSDSSQIVPSILPTSTGFQEKIDEPSGLKNPTNPTSIGTLAFGMAKNMSTQGGSHLEPSCNYEGQRSDRAENSKGGGDVFIREMAPTSSKILMKHRTTTFDQSLIRVPEVNKEEIASTNVHNSYSDDANLSAYSASRPIGNTGGVSELGNLETQEIQTDMNFPRSVSHRSNPTSAPASSGFIEGDEFSCNSADLFYVRPHQVGQVSGRTRTPETSTEVKSD